MTNFCGRQAASSLASTRWSRTQLHMTQCRASIRDACAHLQHETESVTSMVTSMEWWTCRPASSLSLSARTGAEAHLRLRHGLNKPFVLLCARCSRQCARHWPVQAGTRAQKAEGLQTSLALEPRARGQVALKAFLTSARIGMLPRCAL